MTEDMKLEGVIGNMHFKLFKNNIYIVESSLGVIQLHLTLNQVSLVLASYVLTVSQIMIMRELPST